MTIPDQRTTTEQSSPPLKSLTAKGNGGPEMEEAPEKVTRRRHESSAVDLKGKIDLVKLSALKRRLSVHLPLVSSRRCSISDGDCWPLILASRSPVLASRQGQRREHMDNGGRGDAESKRKTRKGREMEPPAPARGAEPEQKQRWLGFLQANREETRF